MSKRTKWLLSIAVIAALVLGLQVAAFANHPEVSLPGSNFEIDTNANLKVDDPAPSIDWASVNETRKADAPSGSGDNSFGNGAKEDTPVPSVVDGSIPPNKSDLLNFGVYLETTPSGARFLNLFWHRVQEPSGTTNMDFEFNQSSTLSGNGVTPVRTAGDLLIQYDLAQGGTNPQLFVSRWVTTGAGSQCEASNSVPCWSDRQNLTAAGDATGSINTTAIPSGESDGLGNVSTRTFGEAQLDFDALTGSGQCTSFGSAYLKSRSSDSFTAALKDFIAPTNLNLNNCGGVIIRKETSPEEDPNSTNFGFSKTFPTQPSTVNTFTLQDDGSKTFANVVQGTGYVVDEDVIPTGWDLQSIDCSASTGVTPITNVAAGTATFDIDSATDVVDCTYTNRARGSIVVEKITDDGQGSFEFTSGTLTPSPFTLTTTAAGAAGKDSETFSDLAPGTYDVAETVPAGWNLVSSTCDDGSDPATIGLTAGETVTCTFHDARERGAIEITKTRKHAAAGSGDHPHAGVTFTVTGGELPAAGETVVTDANGEACLDGLLGGPYTVTETVPNGYVSDDAEKTATVTSEATCSSPDADKAAVSFHNTPKTDVTVTVNSQVDGGTASEIDCVDSEGNAAQSGSTGADGDGSVSNNDLLPTAPDATLVCTITVDP